MSTELHGPLRVAVAGAGGRMGRMLVEAVLAADDLLLCGALDVPGSPGLGGDASGFTGRPCGVLVSADVDAVLRHAQVLIDFTRPQGTLLHLGVCRRYGVKTVIGTTGFDDGELELIAEHAREVAVVMSPNMSVGVNVVMQLLAVAARSLREGYDVEIVEAHHRHKVDAPSGTALKMGEVVAHAQGRTLRDCAVYAREGHTGERDPNSIGFATVRGGDVVGDHTVMFLGTGERIEVSHRASSRQGYAQGSLRAARFLARHATGLFGMEDVLGLR